MDTIRIRPATVQDAEEILGIYTPYVENTAITFEWDVPTIEDFRGRIAHTLEKYPYIVAEKDGKIVGYAYTGVFKGRTAYNWSVESSIYVDDHAKGCGIGRKLYEALETLSRAQHIQNLNACITLPDEEDEYLTFDSPRFHERMGYHQVAKFSKCGYKFGRWYNMGWMEKWIGDHEDVPAPVIPFSEMDPELVADLLEPWNA